MQTAALDLPAEQIAEFCRKWQIQRLWLFGSVLRDDVSPHSDVDVLVEFAPEARWNLLDLAGIEQELSALIGRTVDLVDRQSVEQSDNWIRRQHILATARLWYAAR
ncbi:hypothetical protein A6A03_19375 [Chloroflexus islandicus]|uniref:Polymerase nucleotidyl transferase domain-containing protein n=1 Tax=Chloroflexus islandicus TaxID=1707952 RepID=A0A178LZS0_9CHLR|nr:nucleotidyltransferase family protein [Chloroflexus islandicus]OAN40271.1 hypothetical protein A6A03_19375 [Chloroflexus islandicus]